MKPWLYLAIGMLLLATHGASYRAGGASGREAMAEAAQAASEAARAREKALARSAEKIAEEANAETLAHAARLAAAGDALDRLRAAVAAADARATDAAAAASRDAATARSLLAACAERYRRLGDEADLARGQLLSLQSYVRRVCLAE